MKKIYFMIFVLLYLIMAFKLNADYILKTNGDEIKNCKIEELKNNNLFFRKTDNKLYKIEILLIESFKIETNNLTESMSENKKEDNDIYKNWDYTPQQLLQIYYDLEGRGILDDGKYTDVQKERVWNEKYWGKIAKGQGIVDDVRKTGNNEIMIIVKFSDCHYINLYLKESENEKASNLNKEQMINFIGKLDKLGSGIMIHHTMKDVILVDK